MSIASDCDLQSRVDDLTVIIFENIHCDPLFGHFRGEPTLFDESLHSFLQPPTRVVTTQNVTEDPPPVTVCFQFRIAPALVPVGLATSPAPVPPLAVATALSLVVLSAPVENGVAEPLSPEQPRSYNYSFF